MRKILLLPALACFAFALSAQNLNTTLRTKLTYPGQTLANIWGYVADGREYALVGARNGLIIIDITDPDAPQQIIQIPGPANLWKEIKTYSHYAYVVSEGGWGVQIVDLANLPASNLPYHSYNGDGAIAGQFNKAHALHIDTTKGFLYAYGHNLFSQGAIALDLNADPYNPVYAGHFDQLGYIHDGYVDNDTLYSGHIYTGMFAVVDFSDKSAPQALATQNTPNQFTHNTWPSADKRTLFTTDEKNNSFLAAYDISDLDDIKLLDKIQSNPGSGSMVHNTHIYDNYAVTSWYNDGFTIVDVSRPDNLVQVGNYDTYAGSGGGSNGCWGVYPFFPSGTVIASNINAPGGGPGELFIITPNYARACHLEGVVTDAATGAAINGAQVTVLGSAPLTQDLSAADGQYKVGQVQAGLFTVRVSKAGYQTADIAVQLVNGELTTLDVALFPEGSLTIEGQVLEFGTLTPVPGASVWLYGVELEYSAVSDTSGHFSIAGVSPGIYEVAASAEGFGLAMLYRQSLAVDQSLTLELYPDYRRDGGRPRLDENAVLAAPNPFGHSTRLFFDFPENENTILVFNALGKLIETIQPADALGEISLGDGWSPGVYFIAAGKTGTILKVVKMR